MPIAKGNKINTTVNGDPEVKFPLTELVGHSVHVYNVYDITCTSNSHKGLKQTE